MVGSLYSGISGIRTHQFGLDSTSNNIANVNTTGYRANITEFKSLFSTNLDYINASSPISNDYNYGSTIAANAINANDGTYVSAEGTFNVAYSGKGWFTVGLNKNGNFDIKNPNYTTQQTFFTRDGSFSLDGEGYIVNSSGYYMYGINLGKIAADGTLNGTNNIEADYAGLSGSNLEPLQIPKNLYYKPTLTTEVNLSINLNRTQNPKGINNIVDEKGNFSLDKFLNYDVNALMDGSGKPLDAKNYKDFNVDLINTITNADGSTQDIITSYSFIYGGEGENGFKTMGELQDKLKAQTGLTLGLKLDSNGLPTDCSMYLSNSKMQDIKVNINGKLAEKLGLKANERELESAFSGQLSVFNENTQYKDKDYVSYMGIIFQKNGDTPAPNPQNPQPNANPLEDKNGWSVIDSSAIPTYSENQAKNYAKDTLVVLNGKIYQKQSDIGAIAEVTNAQTGEVTIISPAEDDVNWKEVGDANNGSIEEYVNGQNYPENYIVSYNGVLYKKTNGNGSTNPAEDSRGWTPLSAASLTSTKLNVPSYESNAEIFSDSGEKFILKSQYILLEQGDKTATPEVLERWEVRSAIYDSTGKSLISEEPVINKITFNSDGTANAPIFEVPFNDGSISVDLTKSNDGKTSSNFAYTDSAIKTISQDGVEEGIMKDIVINDDGIIMVNFSNGKIESVGRFGIAAFVNDQGLSKVGGNLFELNIRTINGVTSVVSGEPLLAWNEGGLAGLKFGRVLDKMLETSNVDTGTALTDLIVFQRGYQMSAKSITTADELMKEAIGLKR